MLNKTGATNWARQTLLSDIFFKKPDKWFKIWFFLVNRVNYKDNKQFKRGECFTTYNEISQCTGASKNQIDQFMRWSKSCKMLTTQKTTRGMIVFLLKYEEYQTLDNYKNDTVNDLKTKHKRNINDTINKNVKNVKNVSIDHSPNSDLTIGLAKHSENAFEVFWEQYPRKIGKKKCKILFEKIGHDKLEKVLKSLEIQKNTEQWQDEKYIPHPSTWLNQERWEDEVSSLTSVEKKRKEVEEMVRVHGPDQAVFAFLKKYDISEVKNYEDLLCN